MRFVFWSMLSILRWVWAENVTFEDKLEHPPREKPMSVRGANQQTLGKDENPNSAINKLVFDPDFNLFCEHIGDCHSCPASEKVRSSLLTTRDWHKLLCTLRMKCIVSSLDIDKNSHANRRIYIWKLNQESWSSKDEKWSSNHAHLETQQLWHLFVSSYLRYLLYHTTSAYTQPWMPDADDCYLNWSRCSAQ